MFTSKLTTIIQLCYFILFNCFQDFRRKLGQTKSKTAALMNMIEADSLEKYSPDNQWVTCDQLAMAWMIDDVKNGQLKKNQNSNTGNCIL